MEMTNHINNTSTTLVAVKDVGKTWKWVYLDRWSTIMNTTVYPLDDGNLIIKSIENSPQIAASVGKG